MRLAELVRQIWFFLRRDRMSADLAEEMRLHKELRARRERAAGADAVQAERRAERQFGNSARMLDESRDAWGVRWLDEVVFDAAHGVRTLRRMPVPSAIIILTLAIGIGASLAMFTVLDAALFHPLPVREPERLVVNPFSDVPLEGRSQRLTPLDLPALRERRDIFDEAGAYAAGGLNLTGGVAGVRVQAGLVTPSVLRLLGVQPMFGRIFTEEEGQLGGPDVVVLSHRLWHAQFGADRSILGRRVSVNDRSYEVVGVMPPRFAFPGGTELWIPLTIPLSRERAQVFRFIISTTDIARLAPGATRERANAYYNEQFRALNGPRAGREPIEAFLPFRQALIGEARMRLLTVMGLAALLFLAACANICGLLLARWSSRQREMAVRAAIGAGRRRLLRQLAAESAVVAGAGALAGLVVALAGLRVFEALMPPDLAAVAPPQMGARALAALLLLAIATAIGIGTLPALAATRGDLSRTIKGGALSAVRPGSVRLGSALVIFEVALAVVLLIGSGLLVRTLIRLYAVETGIRSDQVVTARIMLSRAKYPEDGDRQQFYARLNQELQQAGLQSTALVSTLPLRGEWHPAVAFDLLDRPELRRSPFAELVYASPQYFSTMGIRLLAGRMLEPADTLPGGGAIITESVARRWWPDSSPIAARIATGRMERVIVGVVNDVRGTALDGEQNPQLYLAFSASLEATIVARSALPAREALARLRGAVQRVDPDQVVYDMKTMQQVAADALVERRATSALASIFGAITLFLSALGLYGLLAFDVAQRMSELGIRFALGAQRTRVIGAVVGKGMLLTAIGAAIGLAIAF